MDKIAKMAEVIFIVLAANLFWLGEQFSWDNQRMTFTIMAEVILFLVMNIIPCWKERANWRLFLLMGGERILALVWYSTLIELLILVLQIRLGKICWSAGWLANLLFFLLAEIVLMWNGLLRIYFLSGQINLLTRILFWFLWAIPIVNLLFILYMQYVAKKEIEMELEKMELDFQRAEEVCCQTKYPILMVHGVFFRDMRLFNYWGRVPKELARNGATIYYGGQQSAASVEDSARELRDRIIRIVEETHCQKVNIIAHSKGGLDARYAISCLGAAPFVASLTTINTPHHGCAFADYLLSRIPKHICQGVARYYNHTLRRIGDENPDFMGAVSDLTVEATTRINQKALDDPDVIYHSYGSVMKGFWSAPFPQNVTYLLSYHFSKDNDGLVDVHSAAWTNDYQVITGSGQIGISHGDMIDLYRKNRKGFDIREFYVELVKKLKQEGL